MYRLLDDMLYMSTELGLEVLTVVLLKVEVFCDMMLCHWESNAFMFIGQAAQEELLDAALLWKVRN
jgi:hypothetical protein